LNSIMLMNRMRTEGAHDGPYLMMSTGNNTMICQTTQHYTKIPVFCIHLEYQDAEDEGTTII
jgi:hypothetical protein